MKFGFDEPRLKLYKYYFLGLKQPVIIEAYDQDSARNMMDKVLSQLPEAYKQSKIVGQTVSVPLFGITERDRGERKVVWVGKKYSKDNWMDKETFAKKFPS